MNDPFSTLGVPRDATDDQVKVAYRKLAREHHPDLNRDKPETERKASEDRLKEVNAAYEILKDPAKRQRAARGDYGRQQERPDPSDDPIWRFHQDMHAHFHQPPPINRNIATMAVVSLLDAFNGTSIDIEVRTPTSQRVIKVTVPPGVDDGSRLRVVGEGERTHAHLPPGDLFVTIRVQPRQEFHRVAENLVVQQGIDVFEAMLGGQIEVVTIDGTKVHVIVPAGMLDGQQLRVSGHGMPILGAGGRRGDLIVSLRLRLPIGLSDAQKDLLRQARDLQDAA